ncbi:MAG: T9SS type A sorting domain-containing protein, partial [candidate division Zixibacteria bacterium]|nr:T9SS type A sorting domain-containing protein [candidate division Zixibacteria bacterium]
DPEEDSIKFSLLNAPEGASFTDSSNGKATFLWVPPFTGPWSSVNSPFKVTFVALDGNSTSKENVEINVIDKNVGAKDYALEIGADTGFFQDFVTVPIRLTNLDSIVAINLLLNFDPSALSLLKVSKVNTRINNWEYFIYKTDQPDPGDIQITALPNIPDTIFTPPLPPGKGVIINLDFKVILNTSPLSLLTSIRYKFTNSTNNTLSGGSGYQFISQNKIDYEDGYVYIRGMADLLGDINLNNIPFEIADAVLFNNFLTDPIKYPFNEQQKRNSDVNEDGICCSLADFIYLLRQILEGNNPIIAKALPQTNAVQLHLQRSLSTLDLFFDSKVPVGGAFLVIRHPGVDLGTPTLSSEAKDMTLLKKEYPDELRLLIYSPTSKYMEPGKRKLFTIPIIKGMGNIELNKASFSDNIGNMIEADVYLQNNIEVVPQKFTLFQNYPNPFNPETNISFTLPEEGEVNLKIYNLKGQLVKVLVNQKLNSGFHTFTWNVKNESETELPSGIYFYKIIAGEYSEIKKMVRIK